MYIPMRLLHCLLTASPCLRHRLAQYWAKRYFQHLSDHWGQWPHWYSLLLWWTYLLAFSPPKQHLLCFDCKQHTDAYFLSSNWHLSDVVWAFDLLLRIFLLLHFSENVSYRFVRGCLPLLLQISLPSQKQNFLFDFERRLLHLASSLRAVAYGSLLVAMLYCRVLQALVAAGGLCRKGRVHLD